MGDVLIHRGPDDHGVWVDPAFGLALAHRRLAIIDLSPAGHQPMQCARGRFTVAYNGEIYNFRELRRELAAAGATFRGHSDTEVLLAACSEWGVPGALARLNGMFALALWDSSERRLHLARDRMGEKPLYYGNVDGAFVFASELDAFRQVPGFSARLDADAVAGYLTFNRVVGERSIYAGVAKLPPGHQLMVEHGEVLRLSGAVPFWSLDAAVAGRMTPLDLPQAQLLDHVHDKLAASVACRLESDVPVGALLSGGVDSSLVTALMQAKAPGQVRTFCVGFEDQEYDESRFAREVAAHLGTEHVELIAREADALAIAEGMAEVYDEPFADCSQIATHLIARLAREHVKVVLTGDGGDELFLGYNRYVWAERVWRWLAPFPAFGRRLMGAALTAMSPALIDRCMAVARPLLPGSLRFDTPGDRLHKLAGLLTAASREDLYLRLLSNAAGHPLPASGWSLPAFGAVGPEAYPEWMSAQDMRGYLPDDILVKVDRATMAVGLESRAPLLDHELVELSWRIPQAMKLKAGRGKWITRELLYRMVPAALIDRPKTGFAVPIDQWLRGPMQDWASALLAPASLGATGLLDVAHVRNRWEEHLSGRRNWGHFLWSVLMFEAWRARSGASV